MNDRQKIDCASPADRDTLIVILARNGYTVRHGRVIDKLVRDHLNAMRYGDTTNKPNKGGRTWRDSHTGRPRTEKTR